MPSLDKKDLKQIKEAVDESIDERVPKIIDERVPKIIDERVPKIINERVPKIIDERVPKIIDERVPKIIDERVPGIVERVAEPYFTAIQENFNHIDERFDKIEKLILADHKRRIEKLETELKKVKELLAIK